MIFTDTEKVRADLTASHFQRKILREHCRCNAPVFVGGYAMNKKNKKTFGAEFLIGIIFFLVGIGMLGGSLVAVISEINIKKHFQEVQGVIAEIQEYRDSDGDKSHSVFVEYSIMGRKHGARLSEYSSNWYEGKDITLYVDPEDPGRVKTTMVYHIIAGVFGGMGAVFALLGGAVLGARLKKKQKQKKLVEAGHHIFAEVTGGHICYNYQVNGRHPFKLECRYTDVFSGQTYLYSSDYTWEDPEMYIGQQVAVYVDQADMSKYYVDLDSLQSVHATINDFR